MRFAVLASAALTFAAGLVLDTDAVLRLGWTAARDAVRDVAMNGAWNTPFPARTVALAIISAVVLSSAVRGFVPSLRRLTAGNRRPSSGRRRPRERQQSGVEERTAPPSRHRRATRRGSAVPRRSR